MLDSSTIFLFIDESGDPGYKTNNSSDNFNLNFLLIAEDEVNEIEKLVCGFKLFNNYKKELKAIRGANFKNFFSCMDFLLNNEKILFFNLNIEKENYRGPYLESREYNDFRNFILRQGLEYIVKYSKLKDFSGSIEIIFDKYNDSKDYKDGLEKYLLGNYNLPNFSKIIQIDSRYCPCLQVLDIFQKGIKKGFIKTEHYKSIIVKKSLMKKEKSPDIP